MNHRITLLTNKNSFGNSSDSLKLSRAGWTITKGNYQRQDRLVIPQDEFTKIKSLKDLQKFKKNFTIQWQKNSKSNDHLVGEDIPELKDLNINVFDKLIENGYSIYSNDVPNFDLLKFLYNIGEKINKSQFISKPNGYEYNKNSTELPEVFKNLIKSIICEINNDNSNCEIEYDELLDNSYSVSFEKFNEELVITIYWDYKSLDNVTNQNTFLKNDAIKREIGIFELDKRISTINEINVFGMYAQLPCPLPKKTKFDETLQEEVEMFENDEDDILVAEKTMFFINPRHLKFDFNNNLKYNSSFITNNEKTNLHPVHKIDIKNENFKISKTSKKIVLEPPMNSRLFNCELFSYYKFPNELFLDEYELNNLVGCWGEKNLEYPSYKIKKWGSDALIKIDNYEIDSEEVEDYNQEYYSLLELPFHSRYQAVEDDDDEYFVSEIYKPDLFWGCEISSAKLQDSIDNEILSFDEASNLLKSYGNDLINKNPLSSKNPLNFDGLFTNNTVFYHFDKDWENKDYFTIPKGNKDNFLIIQLVTIFTILLSCFYLMFLFMKRFTKTDKKLEEKKLK